MPNDFYRLCPVEFDYALEDWESGDRQKWERMRILGFSIVNSSINIKKPLRKFWDFMEFDWDERPEDIVFSQEYIDRIKARDKKVFEILKKQKNGKEEKM